MNNKAHNTVLFGIKTCNIKTLNQYNLNWFQRRIYLNFNKCKWARKYLGGYWECWYIDCCHADIWMLVNKQQAHDPHYRPGCGFGTPICEYYPIGVFDIKSKFDDQVKLQLKRELKLERVIKYENNRIETGTES